MAEYIALIHKDANSAYGASFPDFPGAVTAESTLEELRREAEEVLALGTLLPCLSSMLQNRLRQQFASTSPFLIQY